MERKLTTAQDQIPSGAMSAHPPAGSRYRRVEQPLEIINVPGALLKLQTLAQLAGLTTASLYRAAARGELILSRRGTRYTRVTSENARTFLAGLARGAE
jgi:hypothetical protein